MTRVSSRDNNSDETTPADSADLRVLDLVTERPLAVHDCDLDDKLAQAAISCVQLGTLTPLIKEELRLTIQSRRLQEGKDQLRPDSSTCAPAQPEQLSQFDFQSRLLRRSRNRVAAEKCRSKRRQRSQELDEEQLDLEAQNVVLRSEISELETEREMLTDMLRSHDTRAEILDGCPRRLSGSTDAGSVDGGMDTT